MDIEYGGMKGFHEAIEAVKDVLASAPVVQERALISQFMEEIARDTNKYAFGVEATMQALEMGVVEHLIVWDQLPLVRYHLSGPMGKDVVMIRKNMKNIDKDTVVSIFFYKK